MQLAPGLHRIGNVIVAAHLIVADEGITLVDAALPGHYADLRRELAVIGRPLSDIRGIVLTHGDSDHIGFAERLRRENGIPVRVGAGDADRATGATPPAANPVTRFTVSGSASVNFVNPTTWASAVRSIREEPEAIARTQVPLLS